MNNKMFIAIGVICILLIGLAGYLMGSTGGDTDRSSDVSITSRSFIKNITSGNVDGTYNNISESFQARNGKEYIEGITKSIKSSNAEITTEEVFMGSGNNKDAAIYLSTVKNLPEKNNSTKGSFIIRLVYESKQWKVDSAQIY